MACTPQDATRPSDGFAILFDRPPGRFASVRMAVAILGRRTGSCGRLDASLGALASSEARVGGKVRVDEGRERALVGFWSVVRRDGREVGRRGRVRVCLIAFVVEARGALPFGDASRGGVDGLEDLVARCKAEPEERLPERALEFARPVARCPRDEAQALCVDEAQELGASALGAPDARPVGGCGDLSGQEEHHWPERTCKDGDFFFLQNLAIYGGFG